MRTIDWMKHLNRIETPISEEWFQQRCADEWKRICRLSPAEVNAELAAFGVTSEDLRRLEARILGMLRRLSDE